MATSIWWPVSAARSTSTSATDSSYQGEMLAAVWAIKTLRPYLHGTAFTLVTDHKPLEWLMTSKQLTGQAARWALSLQEYDFTINSAPTGRHSPERRLPVQATAAQRLTPTAAGRGWMGLLRALLQHLHCRWA